MENTNELPKDMPKTGIPFNLDIRCRDCIYYERSATYEDKCKNLGIQSFSKPCRRFTLDPYQIDFNNDDTKTISLLITNISDKKLIKLAALLAQESKTRKQGFIFGQKVYVKLYQSDYLSNYAVARVISANKEYVSLQGKKGWRGMLFHNSVLTIEEFIKKKDSLIKQNKLKDPNFSNYTTIKLNTKGMKKNYEPKDISEYVKNKKKTVKKGNKDVVKVRG